MARTILTCFAGRESIMYVLMRYARRLLALGHIDEFHMWNFSWSELDAAWLRRQADIRIPAGGLQLSPDEKVLRVSGYDYVRIAPDLVPMLTPGGAPVQLRVATSSDAHLLFASAADGKDVAEAVLGAWGNSRSLIRRTRQGPAEGSLDGPAMAFQSWTHVSLALAWDGTLTVAWSGGGTLSLLLEPHQRIAPLHISVAAWDNVRAMWTYGPEPSREGRLSLYAERPEPPEAQRQGKVCLYEVNERRSWLEYYRHYADAQLAPDDVIIKCDDDIMYIDVERFPAYVARRRQDILPLLLFPSIVNNGMAAWYQQQDGLLPRQVFEATYEPRGFCRLWSQGRYAAALHDWFLSDHGAIRYRALGLCPEPAVDRHPIDARISVNFFAILGRDVRAVYGVIGGDDEGELTQRMPGVLGRPLTFDHTMYVAHLSFNRQRSTGLDEPFYVARYNDLADHATS